MIVTRTNQAAAGMDCNEKKVSSQGELGEVGKMTRRTENWEGFPSEFMNTSALLSHVPRSAKYLNGRKLVQ